MVLLGWSPSTYPYGGTLGPNSTRDETQTNPPRQKTRGGDFCLASLSGVSFCGGFRPGVFSRRFRFLRFAPGVPGDRRSPSGRSLDGCRVGALVLIPAGGCLAPTPTRRGAKQRRNRRASQPSEARLLNHPFAGWLFVAGFCPGVFAWWFHFSAFLRWRVWCWGSLLPGAVRGFASCWWASIYPYGEC